MVREFCLNLHFQSTHAYEFVRETFNKNLPHVSTIRAWYSQSDLNASPGINQKCLKILEQEAINKKSEGSVLTVLILFDEMSIRKHVQWNHSSKRILGVVTYGKDSILPVFATQAIVFMVSGLNKNFQLPIAYHFIDSLNSSERKELLTLVIDSLTKVGIRVATVTFDGLPANLTMCQLLGANLDVFSQSFKPYFIASDGNPVYIILDPCHAEKLVRNTIGNKKILLNENNEQIKWSYFEDLVRYSKNEGFALTHKLNQKHMQWQRKIMKVPY